jgi:hypothetical protein
MGWRNLSMSDEPTPAERIRLPETPPLVERLTPWVHTPEEIDDATSELGCPPYLFNPYLAAPADLSPLGLGHAVFLPVQISRRDGGRRSLLDLEAGQEVLFGIYVMASGIALRFMARDTGDGLPAQHGDLYSTRLTTRDNEELFHDQGALEVIDADAGTVRFRMKRPFRCKCVLGTWFCIPG